MSSNCFSVEYVDGYLFSDNEISQWNGIPQPSAAPLGTARVYYNPDTNKLRFSENLGAYQDFDNAHPTPAHLTATNKITILDNDVIPPLSITERSVAPTSPITEDIYLDDGTNTASTNPGWRRYTGAAWEDVSASAAGAIEGTAVLSTGEGGGTKFLREDGDGTSSWQAAAGGGTMSSFYLEDADGTEVEIDDTKEVKLIGSVGLTINWTDTDPGSDADPFDMTFTIDPAAIAGAIAAGEYADDTVNDTDINWGSGAGQVGTADITEDTDKNFVTDAEATVIDNTSGTNTGDNTDAETGDSATAFFDAGTIEGARLGTFSKSFVILDPVATDDFPLWEAPYAITLTAIHVQCTGGTNIIGGLDEYNSAGASIVAAVDADITATAGASVDDDGGLTNGTIASGNYLFWHTTSISGTPTSVTVSFNYTID